MRGEGRGEMAGPRSRWGRDEEGGGTGRERSTGERTRREERWRRAREGCGGIGMRSEEREEGAGATPEKKRLHIMDKGN